MYAEPAKENSEKTCRHLRLERSTRHIGVVVRLLIALLLIGLLLIALLLIRLLLIALLLIRLLLIGLLLLRLLLIALLLIGLLLERLLLERLLLERLLLSFRLCLSLNFGLIVNNLCFLRSNFGRSAAGRADRQMIAENISAVFASVIHNYSSFHQKCN